MTTMSVQNRRQAELLAPAGGMNQLYAAVENGADAVYLGGKFFNARMNADNFSFEHLQEAIGYAQFGSWELFDRYRRNKVLREEPLPELPLWRISCLFVDKHQRHQHLVRPMVNAVLEEIARQGGGIVEAFPFEFDENPDKFQFNGSVPFYRSLGFEKIDHVGLHEVRMRKIIGVSR